MIDLLLLATATAFQPQASSESDTVFACQYFRNDDEASDIWVHQVDLRVVDRGDGRWTIERPNQVEANAISYPTDLGSAGRSFELRWRDASGTTNTAYMSYPKADLPHSIRYFWLTFDKSSPFKAPGYGCQSAGNDVTGGAS